MEGFLIKREELHKKLFDWIAETEVTYELWKTVYEWAINNGYVFGVPGASPGRQGGDTNFTSFSPVGTDQHSVTKVAWRQIIVWCNALTELYNIQNGTGTLPK